MWPLEVFVVVVDQIFDNLISPRILGHTLGVHPAAVLVAAIIAANLLGLVGVVLEGPQGSLFFKLTGPEQTARAMEDSLMEMVRAAAKAKKTQENQRWTINRLWKEYKKNKKKYLNFLQEYSRFRILNNPKVII